MVMVVGQGGGAVDDTHADAPLPPLDEYSQQAIDTFIDSLWMEAGLARLTLKPTDVTLSCMRAGSGRAHPGAWTTRR